MCFKITRQPFHSFITSAFSCWFARGTCYVGILVRVFESLKNHCLLICSSSCTEPQGCCCEQGEQQQTCIYILFDTWYMEQSAIALENLNIINSSNYSKWCSLIGSRIVSLYSACTHIVGKATAYSYFLSHFFGNAEEWLHGRPLLIIATDYLLPIYVISCFRKAWLVQFQINYFASYPVIVTTLKVI